MFRIKSLLFLLFFFILFQVRSQNLVPNPSFENTNMLPCIWVGSSIEFNSSMQDWTLPTDGTSDIFSTLTPLICYSNCIYSNFMGTQIPRTGNNMCGFYAYGKTGYQSYREYIQGRLKYPLIIGKKYYVEMYVSLAENTKVGCNNIGIYFSDYQITQTGFYENLGFSPQIKSDSIIADTLNWVKISGTFFATTTAKYLIIGNFKDDNSTSINQNTNYYAPSAYYFIDDVFIKDICGSKDTSSIICKGNTITLNLNDKHVTGWSLATSPNTIISNTPTLAVSPLVTTIYIAHYDCNETSIFEVIVDPMPTFTLGKDSTLCQGETISFDATTGHARYLWQDRSTNPTYTVSSTGHYTLTITNGCSSISDDVFITVNKPSTFSFGTDTTICAGETIRFNATTDGATYLWQDGSTNPTYTTVDTGYYAVTIKNNCGTSTENITLYNCCEGANIPNLITPNGDGKNETFYIDCYGHGDYELVIYNIWGAIIYENKAYLNNWGGEHVSDGVYYYVIRYKTKSIKNGWVQVLR